MAKDNTKDSSNKQDVNVADAAEERVDYLDQSDVDQGADIMPLPDATATADIPENILESAEAAVSEGEEGSTTGRKGGKGVSKKSSFGGSNKGSAELTRIRDQIACGFCGINMRFGGNPTVVPIEGKKIRKNPKGQFVFHSPGAAEGKMAAVLCETCTRQAALLPEGAVDIKTIIAVAPDGVSNIAVKDL